MTYFDPMKYEEVKNSTIITADEWFLMKVYGFCEGILDARYSLGVSYKGRIKKVSNLIYKAQRETAIAMWEMGDETYESWVPKWRKVLRALRKTTNKTENEK